MRFRVLETIPAAIRQKVGYTLDRSLVCCRANTKRLFFWDYGRKNVHISMRRTGKLGPQVDFNPGPSFCVNFLMNLAQIQIMQNKLFRYSLVKIHFSRCFTTHIVNKLAVNPN